jgi:acyl-[acyl-carrier-protein]-phospholipid O-acyltransferase/long-chain-fatty-acid--[acyl-carrier-protein] ligase
MFAPAGALEKACGARRPCLIDDDVAVIFSSGSTGEPKGVLLTHFNIDSNVEGMGQAFETGPRDRVLGVLPLFHSFGYMATLWWALNRGLGVVYHPNPKDATAVGELVQRFAVTLLLSTPTFLQLYLRRCTPAQFGSLRVVVTGAEKLPERVSQAFEERFGVRPLEGYGATECAPAIAVSTPDFRAAGFFQPGQRRGSVGQPLPGVAVRIVDPATGAVLPPDTPGMLLVRGPNVMRGYLGREDLTSAAVQDGWYSTGDIAKLDEDGFVFITDRLARFSKIGGEMVPHVRIEDALHELAGAEQQTFAVTAIPDEGRGERLAVLHVCDPCLVPDLLQKLAAAGFPPLFLPRAEYFVRVEALPFLGSGKLDLATLKRTARERIGAMP